jgi:hypothetical protein
VSLTIRYRHPQRPDEAGMILVADQAKAAEIKDQLECRGFLVIEIATRHLPGLHSSDLIDLEEQFDDEATVRPHRGRP